MSPALLKRSQSCVEQEGENSRRPDEGKDLRISRWSVRWGGGGNAVTTLPAG